MRRVILLITMGFLTIYAEAQEQAAAVDSMKIAISKSKTTAEKVYWTDILSRTLMNVSLEEADKYGKQLIILAEESRDRNLMIDAYLSNGTRCSYFAGNGDFITRAIGYYNQALTIARQSKKDDKTGICLLKLSHINLYIPDNEKALDYANQASSILSTVKNDSLTAASYNLYGDVYLTRNNKILALRNYLNALRIAEELKGAALLRECCMNLSAFYSGIEERDKAIDYYMRSFKLLDELHERNVPYMRVVGMTQIGKLYADKKNFDIAIDFYERSVKMADSLKFSTLKVPAYINMLNQYMERDEPKKALAFFNSPQGKGLKDYMTKFGFSGQIDQGYASIYTGLGMYDSAAFYFARAKPFFEKTPNEYMRLIYYAILATFYEKTGKYSEAIPLYLSVKEMADRLGQLPSALQAAKHLDTLYVKTGNYQQAALYNSIYYKYKDSSATLNKEKELAQIEAADEQQRQQKLNDEQAARKARAHNIQYRVITIGIVTLIIALVMLGMFKVSASTIKMLGFFTFLMLFEFIFLLLKKQSYSLTDGEPWKDLVMMILLAAVLLPLHHWMEHKVIHYLTSHNRLTSSGQSLKDRFFRKKMQMGSRESEVTKV